MYGSTSFELLTMLSALIPFLVCAVVSGSTSIKTLLLTPKQAATALAISPRKLWGMTANHEIPHIRLGRCLRYPVSDLMLWIDQHKEGGQVNKQSPSQETGKDIQQGGLTP